MKTNVAQAFTTQPQLLNEVEAGQFLSLSHRTLQNWRVKGGGPKYLKIGLKTVRYRLTDLQSWLEGATRAHT
jgi:predicted DNA-binding transcriptional regulator AlpA